MSTYQEISKSIDLRLKEIDDSEISDELKDFLFNSVLTHTMQAAQAAHGAAPVPMSRGTGSTTTVAVPALDLTCPKCSHSIKGNIQLR